MGMAQYSGDEASMIRVLILDDGLVQREGIAKVVQDTRVMTVVGAAATPQEATAILREQPVDLALVDLVLGEHRSGVEAGREMRRLRPELKVVIYTKEKGTVLAAEVLRDKKIRNQPRLHGYVLTENIYGSMHLKAIYDCIRRVDYYVDPEVLEWHYRLSEFEPLAPREESCARLVAQGYSNREIAEHMALAPKTVENMMGVLYAKFRIPGDPHNPARRMLLTEAIKMLYGLRWSGRKLSVLLVDDNRNDLYELRQMLSPDERFRVVGEAASGRDGIELAQSKRPDLALVDVRMDDLDGFQTTELIAASRPGTRVILISAIKSPIYAEEARKVGAVAYLPKDELSADAIYELGVR